MKKTVVYADLALSVTLSEDKELILTSLSEEEWHVLCNLLYLTINTFTVARALFILDGMKRQLEKDKEKNGG